MPLNKHFLYVAEKIELAALLNIFGHSNVHITYATQYNVGSFIVKDLLRVLELSLTLTKSPEYKAEIQIIYDKIKN